MTFGPRAPTPIELEFALLIEGFLFVFRMRWDATLRRFNIFVMEYPPCLDPNRSMGPEYTNLLGNCIWLANPLLPADEEAAVFWAKTWAEGYLGWILRGVSFELRRDNGH